MRQDKDRSSKWLISHFGDSILRLAGLTGFSKWKAIQSETVAPRRLPDGLIEVWYADRDEPELVLVEIESYADARNDRQVLDDLFLLAVDRGVVPEVVSLILKPRGASRSRGSTELSSPRGGTRIGGTWNVVNLWECRAEDLLARNDVGLVPWVPLAQSDRDPVSLLGECRDRIQAVDDANTRAGLTVVTQILAGLAYSDPGLVASLLRGRTDMIESPMLDYMKQVVDTHVERETWQDAVLMNLEARFGRVPPLVSQRVHAVDDKQQLIQLTKRAATCPSLDDFEQNMITK